jgi:hypothetical protein
VFEYVEFKPSAWPGPTLPIVDRHARDD